MKQHQYKITVEHLCDQHGNPSTYSDKLEFQTGNHDDIFVILNKLHSAELLDEQATQSFAVGLKLFGETLLENKDLPLFKAFMPQFVQFMKQLKQHIPKPSDAV